VTSASADRGAPDGGRSLRACRRAVAGPIRGVHARPGAAPSAWGTRPEPGGRHERPRRSSNPWRGAASGCPSRPFARGPNPGTSARRSRYRGPADRLSRRTTVANPRLRHKSPGQDIHRWMEENDDTHLTHYRAFPNTALLARRRHHAGKRPKSHRRRSPGVPGGTPGERARGRPYLSTNPPTRCGPRRRRGCRSGRRCSPGPTGSG
jgi:hypothetical protein